jgi:hypothetical protein
MVQTVDLTLKDVLIVELGWVSEAGYCFEADPVSEVLRQRGRFPAVELLYKALRVIRTVVTSSFVLFITINYGIMNVP